MDNPTKHSRSSAARYGLVAQGLHWLTAFGLVGSFVLGFIMVELAFSPLQLKMYSWHKWLGVCIWLLVLLRLLWRWWRRPPALPASTPPWQRRAAHVTHAGLYLLLVLIPVTGWLMSSAMGFQTVVFGVVPLPDLLVKNEVLGDRLAVLHSVLNKTLLALIVLHVAAALKHQFIDRDGLLWRMLPIRPRTGDPSS
ncbi:cytochrome b [Algiphilus sp.]|uniref:cytochrome b n=1 Tax=Algiphilus sp. TaxID=1872431 RepID=UPI003B522106